MRTLVAVLAVFLLTGVFMAEAARALDGWHHAPEEGLAASQKSGKPVLVVTIWKDGICAPCDRFRREVAASEDTAEALARYELVEWYYDGLNGKIIPWTLENGGTSHDPSAQAFVLDPEGGVFARAPDGSVHHASAFARWLDEQARLHDRAHPPTRMPFQRTDVEREDGGEETAYVVSALDVARAAGRPVLLYFGRSAEDGGARAARREAKAARRFESSTLDSARAAEAAEGWTLLRFDLADEVVRAWAAQHDVESAPALLMWRPADDAPTALATRISAASLAYQLSKIE